MKNMAKYADRTKRIGNGHIGISLMDPHLTTAIYARSAYERINDLQLVISKETMGVRFSLDKQEHLAKLKAHVSSMSTLFEVWRQHSSFLTKESSRLSVLLSSQCSLMIDSMLAIIMSSFHCAEKHNALSNMVVAMRALKESIVVLMAFKNSHPDTLILA